MEGHVTCITNEFYYDIGPYRIEKKCYERNNSKPCKHYVIDTKIGFTKIFSGKDIFLLLKKYNAYIPHFNYLEDRVFSCLCFSIYFKE